MMITHVHNLLLWGYKKTDGMFCMFWVVRWEVRWEIL